MKRLVLSVMIILLVSSTINLLAQTDWIDFGNGGDNGQRPEIDMYSSTDFSIDFYGVDRYQRTENDTAYDVLLLPGNYGKTIDIGFPQLPVLTFNLEVTVDTPLITVNSTDYIILENFYLHPAQESETLPESDTIPPFTKNDSLYHSNEFYPNTNIQISSPSIIRGHRIVSIIVYPVQHNPVTKEIKVLQSIDFSVHGAGSIESDKDNIVFDNFLQSNVINYMSNSTPDYNIDLLILTPNEFEDDLLPFKEWKEKLGYRTKVFTRNEVENYPPFGYPWIADPEPDEIYSGIDKFIKDAYDLWGNEAPEFVLLIGETDLLPTHYQYNYYGYPYKPSDIYYTTMDLDNLPQGVDWIFDFPDIFIGRISIDTFTDLETIINKTMNYEKNPQASNENFYEDILLTADFEIEDDLSWPPHSLYIEEMYYTYTTETIAEFLDNLYTLNKVYTTGSPDPEEYRNGTPVDPLITFYGEDGGFLEEDATPAIVDAINSGCFLVTHRDHGFSANNTFINPTSLHEGWLHPYFSNVNIPQLFNGELLPVMFSINCQTGWFDGATDYGYVNDHDCFGELLLNYQNGGVVGYIGSIRNSISGYNDELLKGFIDAIWPDFDPFYGSEVSTPSYNLGSILNHGKFFMYNKYILTNAINYVFILDPNNNRATFEVFHVLGDPTLEIWTGVPQSLYAYVDFEQNCVTVYDDNDEVIPDAKVVFQYGPEETEEYEVKMTDINGKAYSNLLNNYDVEVSALKHNYIPWYSTIISDNTTWPTDEDVRGNIIITHNGNLTFSEDITVPKYARIIVMEGGTLITNTNTDISFSNGYNDILAYGNLNFGQNTSFAMAGPGQGKIKLLNETLDYSFTDINFNTFKISGYPLSVGFYLSHLQNSIVEIEMANVSITTTEFDNSYISITNPRNKLSYAHITQICKFIETEEAVYIDGYRNYLISGSEFFYCQDAIRIFNAGSASTEKTITLNNIHDNTGVGLTIYHSYADVLHNLINNNGFGIKSLNRSEVHLEGDNHEVTQEIRDNNNAEVYASKASFPQYFRWNLVEDDGNPPTDPMVLYEGSETGLDVRYNCWGTTFSPESDLSPAGSYIWEPVWLCDLGSGSGEGTEAENMYLDARDDIENEYYSAAQTTYQEIIVQYPNTKYAQASLKELFSLEAFINNDYSELKSYYNSEPNITNNPDLVKLADFLINFCDIKLENWPTAIAWFEDVIQNPDAMEDSIFAIIDLGYTYFLMENGGLKSSYAGSMTEHIPQSVEQFEEKRDYLLSLIPGDQISESLQENLSVLKSGELLQNIPNPFTGITNIYYKLEKEVSVCIIIYDYSGRRLQTIRGKGDAGINKVQFDSSGLPSGIYFYNLEVNGQVTDSKKMTVMK